MAPGGVTIRVRVQPRADRNQLAGERGGALLLRVTAAPAAGAANAAAIRLLAQALAVPASRVEIRRGASGRDKLLHVRGLGLAEVEARLAAAGGTR